MATFRSTRRGHITRADKARSDYFYVPFDLPFAASRLHVRYEYTDRMSSDRVDGGNVIDLGLFDPRGAEFPGGAGFRGWSGSARSEFTVTQKTATPGYLAGPLPAGRYQVVLGLYRIWEAGAGYTIHIEAEPESKMEAGGGELRVVPPDQPDRVLAPAVSSDPLWLRGDLQSHTHHSDAKGTPEQLIAKARALNLDFLAVTDHNTVSHHQALAALGERSLLLIPGQEVTTYYGHMNVWGTGRWCDFRAASQEQIAEIIDLAHAAGGTCSINHPKAGGPAWEFGHDLDVQAMEVWQGPWPYRNDQSLALWDKLLCAGRRLPGVGGSDYHCPAGEETGLLRLGQPTTWVNAEARTVAAVLDAVRAGRVCISAHPNGPRLDLIAHSPTGSAPMGGVLPTAQDDKIALTVHLTDAGGYRLDVIADGAVIAEATVDPGVTELHFAVRAQRYVRCELVGDMSRNALPPTVPAAIDLRDWRWAMSNPIYLR